MENNGRNNERIDALRKREAEIRARIAAERVRQQRRAEKEYERLKSVIGGVLLESAAQHPDFELMLKSTLASAALGESDRKLLRAKGWLA